MFLLLFQFGYNKTYKTNEDYLHRRSVFTENYKLIAEHNELYVDGQKPYGLGVNTYSDLVCAWKFRIGLLYTETRSHFVF